MARYLVTGLMGLLSVILLLELGLHLLAWWASNQSRHVEARWVTGHARILALGDSNTYGLYLEAPDSWPMQLEQAWNRAHATQPVEVLNLGYPGTNSYRVRENLPVLLDKLMPDLVFIMVGFNDFWTPRETPSAQEAGPDPGRWLRQHSRLYKAWVMWERQRIVQSSLSFGSPRPSEHEKTLASADPQNKEKHLLHMDGEALFMGVLEGEPARNMKGLEENLGVMIGLVRQQGADVALLTYPSSWGFYPAASKWIRRAGEQHGVPVIELSPMFRERCPSGPESCPALLFHDGHATAQGNALVAETVRAFLERRLQGQ